MNSQRISKGKVQAIRIFGLAHDTTIQNDLPVRLLPELGAVAYNIRITNQTLIRWWHLVTPERIEGLAEPANYYVEVWKSNDGNDEHIAERWFFSGISDENLIYDFIVGFFEAQKKHIIDLSRSQTPPAPFIKSDTWERIDPYRQAIEVTRKMMLEEYPCLAKQETPAALMIDNIRIHGRAAGTLNLEDPATVEMLSEAHQTHARRTKRKTIYDAADYYIAHPKVWPELCRLKPEEIAARVKAQTGIELSANGVQQRISRLELTTALKRGPRVS